MNNLNLDIFELITNLLPIRDIIAWSQTNKLSEVLSTSIYRDHLLLLQKDNFDTHEPNYIVLEFHIKHKVSDEYFIYYSILCSKYKFYPLLRKIYQLSHNSITNEQIFKNILINSNDEKIIPILKLFRGCARYISKYCESYKILNAWTAGLDRYDMNWYVDRVIEYYNDVLLKIFFEKSTVQDKRRIIKKIIKNTDNIFWSNDIFRILVVEEIGTDAKLLRTYSKKMFLYGCEYKSFKYFQENNLVIDDRFPIFKAIDKCCDNVFGLDIIKWIIASVKIHKSDIRALCFSVIRNKDICNFWIDHYDNILVNGFKKITTDTVLSDQYINAFYKYLDHHIIINHMTYVTNRSPEKIMEHILPDVLNYLCTNIDFTKIYNHQMPLLLLCFWRIKDKRMLNKFIISNIPDKNKILIKFLYLVSEHTNINDTAIECIYPIINDVIWQ